MVRSCHAIPGFLLCSCPSYGSIFFLLRQIPCESGKLPGSGTLTYTCATLKRTACLSAWRQLMHVQQTHNAAVCSLMSAVFAYSCTSHGKATVWCLACRSCYVTVWYCCMGFAAGCAMAYPQRSCCTASNCSLPGHHTALAYGEMLQQQ
jgi:hypothetical protein